MKLTSQTTCIFQRMLQFTTNRIQLKTEPTENGNEHDTKLCMQNMFIDSVLFRTSGELLLGCERVLFNSLLVWIFFLDFLFLSLFRVIDRMHLKVMLLQFHFHFPCATHKFESNVLKELYESRHIFTFSFSFEHECEINYLASTINNTHRIRMAVASFNEGLTSKRLELIICSHFKLCVFYSVSHVWFYHVFYTATASVSRRIWKCERRRNCNGSLIICLLAFLWAMSHFQL